MKYLIIGLGVLIALLLAVLVFAPLRSPSLSPANNTAPAPTIQNPGASTATSTSTGIGSSTMVIVDTPAADSAVSSPVKIKGQARGPWFFEAVFPIRIVDDRGKVLGRTQAKAIGDWMTSDLVPFEATLNFAKPETAAGKIILEKDNPSLLPQNAAEFVIPVKFAAFSSPSSSASGACRVTGCSSQICADRDTATTCEYNPKYACYSGAKCARQPDGRCGWTMTAELQTCLSRY